MFWRTLRYGLALSALAGIVLFFPPFAARAWLYGYLRSQEREHSLSALHGYQSLASDRFIVYYSPEDARLASIILEAAEGVHGPVTARLGYTPPGQAAIVVYPTRERLRAAFGWGEGESALGAYWGGVIKLLSPRVWIGADSLPDLSRTFRRLGPLAHEYAHYVLDHLATGNYPRWFTEGLAQRIEFQITGYLWDEPEAHRFRRLYTLSELEGRFDDLGNQPLAYRQSYLLVEYLAERLGEGGLRRLVADLGAGIPFRIALWRHTGFWPRALESGWLRWLQDREAGVGSRCVESQRDSGASAAAA